MNSWKEVALGEVAKLSWGNTKTTKASYTQSGWPAYSASGPDGYLSYFEHDKPGVVISAIGALCGKTWLATGNWSCIKNTMWMRGDGVAADTSFLFYATRRPDFWPRRGAAQPFISLGDARAATLELPSMPVQHRISAVLSAFDELIEVNERRIELLEDLSRSLYREWFVHFRFPGHREVEFVDSELGQIPEGWNVHSLGEVAKLRYGKSLPAKTRRPGDIPVVSSAGIIGEHDRALVEGPGVVVGRKGNVGSVWWVEGPFFPIDTTYYVESGLPLGFLYWLLRDADFIDSHAAVPGLSREQATSVRVVIPSVDIVQRFDDANGDMLKDISGCRARSEHLAATRDLLLPRLVTGQLDVSDIDLGILTPAEAE